MEPPFPAYRGDDNYAFICYSHKDAAEVYGEIESVHAQNINVWYDEGIRPGLEWTAELANAISRAHQFIFFATSNSVSSRHCRDEIQFALNHDIPMVVVWLQEVEFPPSLELTLGSIQAVKKQGASKSRYHQQLFETLAGTTTSPTSSPIPRSEPPKAHNKKNLSIAFFAAAVLVALGIGISNLPLKLTEPTPPTPSIALLPFSNQGGFDDNYYPESVAEDLLNRLVSIDGLRVASRRASFVHSEADNLVEVAEKLGVQNILSGTIRLTKGSIRLYLELVGISDHKEVILWSKTYANQTTGKLLSVFAEVTNQVATEFFPQGIDAQSRSRIVRHSTQSVQAYELYLAAQAKLRSPFAQNTLDEAAVLYRKAIALDPDFAWAKAGLCQTYITQYARVRTFEKAQPACEALIGMQPPLFEVRLALGRYYRETGQLDFAITELIAAVEQNQASAEAYVQLARAYSARYDLKKNETDKGQAQLLFLRAIEAEPDYWGTYHTYATYLSSYGDHEQAEAQLQHAVSLQPQSMPSLNNLANIQFKQGKSDLAEATWRRSLSIDNNNVYAHSGLATLLQYRGQTELSIQHLEKAVQLSPADHRGLGRLAEALTVAGEQQRARSIFVMAIDLAEGQLKVNADKWQTLGFLGLYYAHLDDHDTAARYITRMFSLNATRDPLTHYWAGIVAVKRGDIETAFEEVEQALARGFGEQPHFITAEPALAVLSESNPTRFNDLIEKYRQ
ncbi:MAG: tetratricopeptide (TPR) repeat protein/TolB-like protein [Limisphaerales bacterium]